LASTDRDSLARSNCDIARSVAVPEQCETLCWMPRGCMMHTADLAAAGISPSQGGVA
jgi:hypothetical protein